MSTVEFDTRVRTVETGYEAWRIRQPITLRGHILPVSKPQASRIVYSS